MHKQQQQQKLQIKYKTLSQDLCISSPAVLLTFFIKLAKIPSPGSKETGKMPPFSHLKTHIRSS